MLMDYRLAQEEEERYRILTVKTNKVPETKKVKSSSSNIFSTSNENAFKMKPANKNNEVKNLK